MKRVAAITFLSVMILSLVGIYGYFGVRMHQIHEDMRAQLRKTDPSLLTRLTMSLDDFTRARIEDDEIEWKGHMFDVAYFQVEGSQAIVFGEFDEEEDNLLSLLDGILRNSLSDEEPVPDFGENLEFTMCEGPSVTFITYTVAQSHTAYRFSICESFQQVWVQPPRG